MKELYEIHAESYADSRRGGRRVSLRFTEATIKPDRHKTPSIFQFKNYASRFIIFHPVFQMSYLDLRPLAKTIGNNMRPGTVFHVQYRFIIKIEDRESSGRQKFHQSRFFTRYFVRPGIKFNVHRNISNGRNNANLWPSNF